MGSYEMALILSLCVCLVGGVAGQLGGTLLETSTPVSILRDIDSQNRDGSYAYGFENADGTYRIETRLVDGQVRGKYGYYDPEGKLREATYGATAERGFEPQVEGFVQPIQPKEYQQQLAQPTGAPLFAPLPATPAPAPSPPTTSTPSVGGDVRLVNGRPALLKRRLVKRPRTQTYSETETEIETESPERLRARQLQAREHRRLLARRQRLREGDETQGNRQTLRSRSRGGQPQRQRAEEQRAEAEAVRQGLGHKESRTFQSFLPRSRPQQAGPSNPYIRHGDQFGSYSISYTS